MDLRTIPWFRAVSHRLACTILLVCANRSPDRPPLTVKDVVVQCDSKRFLASYCCLFAVSLMRQVQKHLHTSFKKKVSTDDIIYRYPLLTLYQLYMVLCNYVDHNLHVAQISRCVATFHCAFGAISCALFLRTYHCPFGWSG